MINALLPPRSVVVIVACATLLGGCRDGDGERRGLSLQRASEPSTPAPLRGREYTRRVVFVSTDGDTALVVPFSFRSRAGEHVVERRIRGSVARQGTWETFVDDRWETPPTRTPWRLHPRASVRLLVGGEDRLDGILYREGGRGLEVALGEELAEWGGGSGVTLRLLEGEAVVSGRRIPGTVLDVSGAWEAGDPPEGDVSVLVSGDSLLVVLEEPRERSSAGIPDMPVEEEAAVEYGGWALVGGEEEILLDPVRVEWDRRRAYEESRRDVPTAWRLAGGGDVPVRGRLEARASEFLAGEGEGPVLPVEGLNQVEGTLVLGDRSYPVHGFLRHAQP